MENTDKKAKIDIATEKFQEVINELKNDPQYTQYIKQRKLHLIDSRLIEIDILLTAGVLK